jgi:hypothetical protein
MRPLVVRPAIREILGRRDGEETAEPRHRPANGFDGPAQPTPHLRRRSAQRGVIALHHALELGMCPQKIQWPRPGFIQIEIDLQAVPRGALDQSEELLLASLEANADPLVPRERRQVRQQPLQPDSVHPDSANRAR